MTSNTADPFEVRGSVAHDVANGFAAITGAGELLLEHWEAMTDVQRTEMLDIVATGTQRLATVFTALVADLPDDLTASLRALLDAAPVAPRRAARR